MSYKKFKQLIYSDMLQVICKYLLPEEIITLFRNYPKTLKKIKYIFPERVAQEIDYYLKNLFKEKFPDFKNNMIESNAYLSGSVILKASYGKFEDVEPTVYNKSDLDIFLMVDPIYKNYTKLDGKDYTFCNYEYKYKVGYSQLHDFCFKNNSKGIQKPETYITHSQYKEEMGENVIIRLNNYSVNSKYIQLIEINKEKYSDFDEFINKSVDFSICKNYFYYNRDGSFTLKIFNLESILDKKSTFNYVGSLKKSLLRCEKYLNRGIDFYTDPKIKDFNAAKQYDLLREKLNLNNSNNKHQSIYCSDLNTES